jgi:hypothetical protein
MFDMPPEIACQVQNYYGENAGGIMSYLGTKLIIVGDEGLGNRASICVAPLECIDLKS